jgi:hypothetical protein
VFYKIPWADSGISNAAFPSIVSNDITIGRAGIFRLSAAVTFNRPADIATTGVLAAFVNGVQVPGLINQTSQFQEEADQIVVLTGLLSLSLSDVVDLRLMCPDAANRTFNITYATFDLATVGATQGPAGGPTGGIGATGVQGPTGPTGPMGQQGPVGPGYTFPQELVFLAGAAQSAVPGFVKVGSREINVDNYPTMVESTGTPVVGAVRLVNLTDGGGVITGAHFVFTGFLPVPTTIVSPFLTVATGVTGAIREGSKQYAVLLQASGATGPDHAVVYNARVEMTYQ